MSGEISSVPRVRCKSQTRPCEHTTTRARAHTHTHTHIHTHTHTRTRTHTSMHARTHTHTLAHAGASREERGGASRDGLGAVRGRRGGPAVEEGEGGGFLDIPSAGMLSARGGKRKMGMEKGQPMSRVGGGDVRGGGGDVRGGGMVGEEGLGSGLAGQGVVVSEREVAEGGRVKVVTVKLRKVGRGGGDGAWEGGVGCEVGRGAEK